MKTAILILAFYSISFTNAQVGIGTTTPSNNSELDITSTTKGLMLPRLNDTSSVANPTAGLLIYNMKTKFPSFHNGASWNALSAATTTATSDSITYTITNPNPGFANGTFKIASVAHGLTNTGSTGNFQNISFIKSLDINSTGFAKAIAVGAGAGSMVIEIKFYSAGSSTPYYSLKASSIRVTGYSLSLNSGGSFAESISILPLIFGYKDWVNNVSFAWSEVSHTVVAY